MHTDAVSKGPTTDQKILTQIKRKGMKKGISCKWKGKKTPGVAVLTSNKIDIKTKSIVRQKEGHYIMIKGTIQQEDTTLVNIYAPNKGASKYIL